MKPEVEARIAGACKELLEETLERDSTLVRLNLRNALLGHPHEVTEGQAVDRCLEHVKSLLESKDAAGIAKFGRMATECEVKDSGKNVTQDQQVYLFMKDALQNGQGVLSKTSLTSPPYSFAKRTVERCFKRIVERGNLRRVTENGEEIWTLAPPP